MLREKCLRCGSSDVYTGRLYGQGGIFLNSALSLFKGVAATKCLACVTCGSLEPYLDEKGMAKVRDWKAKEGHQFDAPRTEGLSASPNLLLIMIALAIAGIAAALAVPLMQMGDKINGTPGH